MTTHTMNLQEKYFDFIAHGSKRIELRLNDAKRQRINLNDQIIFETNGRQIVTRVTGLLYYCSFRELCNDFVIDILADKSLTKNQLLRDLEKFYSAEQQQKLGVIGIRLQLL